MASKIIQSEFVGNDENGLSFFRCIVTCTEEPDLSDIKVDDIEGLPPESGIAAGSIFLYPDNEYKIAYEDITQQGSDPEEDTMKVNLTYDGTAKTLTMDKTADEIIAAINEGKIVTAVCTDANFLASWTAVDGTTGAMSGHVTTAYGIESEGTVVDAITTNGSDISGAPLQLSFFQAEGEGNYPVYQMQ